MKSTEKIWALIEHLADSEDHELDDAMPLPLPPTLLRVAIGAIGEQLPQDPAELDAFLEGVSGFCLGLRSDPEPVAIEAGDA